MCLCYCVLWLVAAIIVTVYAAQWEEPPLEGAAVSLYYMYSSVTH